MSLTLSDVKRIANLAQLDMDDAHAETALSELNGIFALAEQMQAVDTTDVAPLSHPLAAILALPLRLRDDVERSAKRIARLEQMLAKAAPPPAPHEVILRPTHDVTLHTAQSGAVIPTTRPSGDTSLDP